ncbi:MAG: hypothetical protein FWC38_04660 [Proteobacteria bacterium]|nr:hypothetical protein [Pseudomonadota bacterium]
MISREAAKKNRPSPACGRGAGEMGLSGIRGQISGIRNASLRAKRSNPVIFGSFEI